MDVGVGKSCIAHRFAHDRFDHNQEMTIGACFLSKFFHLDNETIRFNIWDTAGQEKYRALVPMFYRGAAAAIIVYEITSEASFNSTKNWVEELKRKEPNCTVIVIAGNKCDLEKQREVSRKRGQDYAEGIQALFAETSAKTAQNVEEMFAAIGNALPPEPACIPPETLPKEVLSKSTAKRQRGKCC